MTREEIKKKRHEILAELVEIRKEFQTCNDPEKRGLLLRKRFARVESLQELQERHCPHPDRDTTIVDGYIHYGPCDDCGKGACAEKLVPSPGGGRR